MRFLNSSLLWQPSRTTRGWRSSATTSATYLHHNKVNTLQGQCSVHVVQLQGGNPFSASNLSDTAASSRARRCITISNVQVAGTLRLMLLCWRCRLQVLPTTVLVYQPVLVCCCAGAALPVLVLLTD
jgi:hypothetical protein